MKRMAVCSISAFFLTGLVACSSGNEKGASGSEMSRISARIENIDTNEGLVTLASDSGPLQLQVPPQSLEKLEKDREVTVQLAFWTGGRHTGVGQAFDVPAQGVIAQNTVTGKVRDVDYATGHVSLQSNKSTMELYFPPASVASVKPDNQITVEIALMEKGSRSQGQQGMQSQ